MATKRRPLYFSYDPGNPTEIHVMFDQSDREHYPDRRMARGWTRPNAADVKRMAGRGLFVSLVVHTSEARRSVDAAPHLSVDTSTNMDGLLDIIRQMGPPQRPTQPKAQMQVPFDADGNLLHRSRSHSNVVWKPNHTFMATMTFGTYVKGGPAADYIRMTDEHGKRYGMFIYDLEKAIHHVDHGRLSGRFTFCKRGISYGVRFLETEEAVLQRIDGDGRATQMSW